MALDVHWESDGFEAPAEVGGELPYLDVSATIDEQARKLFISVVNRHKEQPITANIEINGADVDSEGLAHLVTGDDPEVTNSFGKPENVSLQSGLVQDIDTRFAHEFSAHSMTILELLLR